MAGDGYFDSGTDEHVLVLMAALYVRASGCFEVGSQLLLAGKSKDGGGRRPIKALDMARCRERVSFCALTVRR